MKNTKKIISLVLAICMLASLAISASAANTVDASGGTGTSSVTLSSTADGSIGGDPAATKMSVTVPTVLPIAVGTDGTVSTATDAKIVNNSFGAVKVNSVSIEAAQGWSLAAFGDKATLAHEKVNANKFGFSLCLGDGEKKMTDDKNASKQTLLTDAINGCFMSGVGDTSANSIGIAYRFYTLCLLLLLCVSLFCVQAFAVEDMWTAANRIIVDVYSKIVGVSTVLAGLMSAVAVVGAKLSNNQHKVDQAWDWLRRIWIAWAVINGIGAFIAYVAPLFQGLATIQS